MFGMSMEEIILILVVGLVFMGPEKIPEAARFMGKMFREVRKASNLLRDAMMIDDEPSRPIRPTAATAPKSVEAEPVRRDPDPKRDLRVAAMSPPRSPRGTVSELALQLAAPVESHRDVYLHIPYDETI